MGVFLPPLSATAVGSDVVEDDLAYADVFTMQREHVPAGMLVELLLERIAVLDAPAPGSHKSLRSVLAISETPGTRLVPRTSFALRTHPCRR